MAKLIRPTRTNIFGSAALSAELTEFGGSVPSTDINAILNNAAADRGWGTVGANGFPPMEWFNALGYGLSYYAAYLMQDGIPKWTDLQNYYVNSYAVGSDGKLYRSKTGIDGTPNVGNNPVGDTTNWENSSDVAGDINAAPVEAPEDTDKIGFWDSFTKTLRGVTFATLKTIFAVLDSPAFTGTPTAPTAAAGTNTTQLATTAFVKAKSELDSIGVGQTWQLVTRTSGVQYTNSTGKPIALRVQNTSPVNVGSYTTIAIDGVSMLLGAVNNSSTTAGSTSDMIIIGVGKTYTLTDTNVSARTTYELR